MTRNPNLPSIARVRRLMRPTVYRVFLTGELTHIRQFDHAQEAIDWMAINLPNRTINNPRRHPTATRRREQVSRLPRHRTTQRQGMPILRGPRLLHQPPKHPGNPADRAPAKGTPADRIRKASMIQVWKNYHQEPTGQVLITQEGDGFREVPVPRGPRELKSYDEAGVASEILDKIRHREPEKQQLELARQRDSIQQLLPVWIDDLGGAVAITRKEANAILLHLHL